MAAHSLSFSLLTRMRAPLLLRLLCPRRQRLLPAGSAALATRGFCSSAPSRPRGALLGARGRRQRGGVGSRTMSSSTNSTMAAELAWAERAGNVEMLPFVNDKHGGVIVEMTTPMDPHVFSASLKVSLSKWREQVVSLTMGISYSAYEFFKDDSICAGMTC